MRDEHLIENTCRVRIKARIAYVLTRFPQPTETFILNELMEMRRQGLEYELFAFHVNQDLASLSPYSAITPRQIPRPLTREVLAAAAWALRSRPTVLARLLRRRVCRRTHHLFQAMYLGRLAAHGRIGHFHAHYAYHSTSAARAAACIGRVGYSFTAHANDIYKSRWQLKEKIEESVFCATCTGYNARFLKERFAAGCPEKILKIYHGIDLNMFRDQARGQQGPAGDGCLNVVSIGRLREKKGFPYLLRACSLLKKKGIVLSLKIIGDGPDRPSLEAMIKDLGLGGMVELMGHIPHASVKVVLERADVFVLPCIVATDGSMDGLPNVILEAMAMGLPVVSTDISAIPEAVLHGETGLLVQPADPVALADALASIWRAPEMGAKMGRAGREVIRKRFGLEENTRRLIREFERVLAGVSSS